MATLPELPADYKSFLESNTGKQPYEFDDVGWWLATSDKLLENVSIDGNPYPFIHQLRGYASTIAEFFDGDATCDAEGNDFAFARLEAGLAIATGNGDVLFLDPAHGFSVWCFHHDGGDVEKQAASFGQWLSDAKLDETY